MNNEHLENISTLFMYEKGTEPEEETHTKEKHLNQLSSKNDETYSGRKG